MTDTTAAWRSLDALPERRTSAAIPWLVVAILFAAAIACRHVVAANTDVSWLLIASERLLDGQKLYAQIFETNPPMAVLTYMPAIVVERLTGVAAETVLDALVFVAVALSIGVTVRILRASRIVAGIQHWPLIWLATAVLAILPMQTFGQREHIAMLELLPALAVLARRLADERPQLWAAIVSGLGLGLALSFKPHFVVAYAAGLAMLSLLALRWRLLFAMENWIAGSVLLVYGTVVLTVFPDYVWAIGPMARDIYLPIGVPIAAMLQKPPLWIGSLALLVSLFAMSRRLDDRAFRVLIVMAATFGAIYYLQRKGWPYHSYPMLVLSLLSLGWAMLRAEMDGRRHTALVVMVLLAGLFARSAQWFTVAFDARPIQPVVARYGPHPVVMSVSGEAGLNHPLVRALGGRWGSREQNLIISSYQRYAEQIGALDASSRAMFERYAAQERQWFVEDFKTSRPTVVLVDNLTDDWGGWARAHPEIADLLKDYRIAENFEGIDIMVPDKTSTD